MTAAEVLAPTISEPLTWDEICARHPDEWVCLAEIDFTHPNNMEFRTARVIGNGKTQSESLDQATTSFPQYDEIGHFYTNELAVTYLWPAVISDDETHFATHDELIVVIARITGPRRTITAPLILDTGAVYTTITPKVAETVDYSERDGIRRARVRTAIGSEQGYCAPLRRARRA